MKEIIIFGAGQLAEVADFYFKHDTDRRVAAFTVDAAYVQETAFAGRPVLAFEEVAATHPPEQYDLFVAVSYAQLNQVRARKMAEAEARGYGLASYVSSKATVWPGLSVGKNAFILEDNTIQPFVRIGDGVTLWSGNHIGHHASIGDYCFITSQVVVSGGVRIEDSCFVGVNATIRDHVVVGPRSIIGAGALILQDAPAESVYPSTGTERSKVPSSRVRRI
ncbi:acetyltransferase [Azospirillum sp. TSO35-2]|uniref:acetyltransferase n=1 Tax=Azospirillum sp. TSO35-2 TaxID=716796 RepID=UPI000D608F11|nr:acetyltransferase [Azospirillum sp. TSO35-2]PWC40308.1 transferase [Azospirillum sp. TSO35-2]